MKTTRSGLAFAMISPALEPDPVPEPPVLFEVSLIPERNRSAMPCRFGYRTFPPTAACIATALLEPLLHFLRAGAPSDQGRQKPVAGPALLARSLYELFGLP